MLCVYAHLCPHFSSITIFPTAGNALSAEESPRGGRHHQVCVFSAAGRSEQMWARCWQAGSVVYRQHYACHRLHHRL